MQESGSRGDEKVSTIFPVRRSAASVPYFAKADVEDAVHSMAAQLVEQNQFIYERLLRTGKKERSNGDRER
jgi:hypothetical protein